MKVAAEAAVYAFSIVDPLIQPGITTLELDQIIHKAILDYGCKPAFLNYKNFPNVACISVNEGVVHCIPSERKLNDGDIVTLDLGAIYNGFCSDTAKTYLVGNVNPVIKHFVQTGYESLVAGIKQAKPGNHINDISTAVNDYIHKRGFSIVKKFVGHGIGRVVHEEPQVPNFKMEKKGPELIPGMVICIEPILAMGTEHVFQEGPWNIVTVDGKWACHFEHTIWITENDPVVLTKRPEETF